MFKRFILSIFARICGVYLVKFRPEVGYHTGSQLAITLRHPLSQVKQDIAVLHPARFPNLQNSPIIKEVEVSELKKRPMRDTFMNYIIGIYDASEDLKRHQKTEQQKYRSNKKPPY